MNFSITNTRSKIILAFAISSALALFFFVQQYFWAFSFDKEFNFVKDLTFELIYFYTWGILFFIIVPFANKYRLEKSLWIKSFSIHILFGLVIAFIHRFGAFVPYYLIFYYEKLVNDFSSGLVNKVVLGIFDSFISYWFILGAYYGIDYYRQYREHKLKAKELENQLAHAHLRALKMQLQPHFLFNTMHAISTLMEEDVKTARQMIAKLSNLLRQTLDNIGVEEVSLNQELEFLKSYLEIEQTRFQERLKIVYNIDDNTLNASVPNLILQPLVENAIKHGITPFAEGGQIEITSKRDSNNLVLKVSDNGKGSNGESYKEGVGLKNTRERLQQLYGNKFIMEIKTANGNGFTVVITIPYNEFNENSNTRENND